MAVLYTWLRFVHLLSIGAFLFVHGVTGGASFLLRGPISVTTRPLLRVSQIPSQASYPLLLLIVVTGIWMAFAGHWAARLWPWAALVILIATIAVMGFVARPYYLARDAAKGPDNAVAVPLSRARPVLAAVVGALALVLLFWLMVFKPF